jgi:hypothetical protein
MLEFTGIRSFAYSTYVIDQGPDCSFFSLEGRLISLIDIGSQAAKAVVVTTYALTLAAFKTFQGLRCAGLALLQAKGLDKSYNSFQAAGSYFCSALQCGLFHRITAIAGDILGFVVHPVIGQRTRQEIDAISAKVRDATLPLVAACFSLLFLAKYPQLMHGDGRIVALPFSCLMLEGIAIGNAWTTPNRFYKGLFHYKSMSGVEDQVRRDFALSFYNKMESMTPVDWAKALLAPLDQDWHKALQKVPQNLDLIEFNLYVRAYEILKDGNSLPRFEINDTQRKKIHLALLKDGRAIKRTLDSIFGNGFYERTIHNTNRTNQPIIDALLETIPISLERYEGALTLFASFNSHIEETFKQKYDSSEIHKIFRKLALLYGDQETQLAAAKCQIGGCDYCSNEKRHEIALKALRKKPKDLSQLMAIEILLQDALNKTLQELYNFFNGDDPFTKIDVLKFMGWKEKDFPSYCAAFQTGGMTMTLQKAFEKVIPDTKWSDNSWDRNLYPHARRYFALRALELTASAPSSVEIRKALHKFRLTHHSDKGGDLFSTRNAIVTASANFLLSRKPPQTGSELKELEEHIKLLEQVIPKISDAQDEQTMRILAGFGIFSGDPKAIQESLTLELQELKNEQAKWTDKIQEREETITALLPGVRYRLLQRINGLIGINGLIEQCKKDLDYFCHPYQIDEDHFYRPPRDGVNTTPGLSSFHMDAGSSSNNSLIRMTPEQAEKAINNLKMSLAILGEKRASLNTRALPWTAEWHAQEEHRKRFNTRY